MAAGFSLLSHLHQNPSIYSQLEETGATIEAGLRSINTEFGKNYTTAILAIAVFSTVYVMDKLIKTNMNHLSQMPQIGQSYLISAFPGTGKSYFVNYGEGSG